MIMLKFEIIHHAINCIFKKNNNDVVKRVHVHINEALEQRMMLYNNITNVFLKNL